MLPPTPSRVLTSKMKALPFHMFYREGTTDEKVMAEIFTKQAYKKPIIGFEVEAGDMWLDLGAHIGCFSLWAIENGAAKVYAYEPEPSNFELLSKNAKGHNISANNAAVGWRGGKAAFNIAPNTWRHSLLRKYKRGAPTIDVEVSAIDSLIEKHPDADCIKMDIEGAEIEILEKKKEWNGIRKLVFEYSFTQERDMGKFFGIVENLKQSFDVVKYPKSYHNQKHNGLNGLWGGFIDDVIFAINYDEPS